MTATAAPAQRCWNGTLARSRWFDGISLLLPAAETFLIATMEQWLAQAGDSLAPSTRADVEHFIREERAHQHVHRRYNEAMAAATPGVGEVARRASHAADGLAGLDLHTKMALVAAFEYLTSVLSSEMLERPYLLGQSPSTQRRIWRWHAREEIAHSHIALNAGALLGIGVPRRVLAYVAATCLLGYDVLRLWYALCRCDVAAGASRRQLCVEACAFLLRGVPSLGRMAAGWASYFRAGQRPRCPATPAATHHTRRGNSG